MVILAWINTLLKDCGSGLGPAVATGREEEIRSKKTTVAAGVARGLSMSGIVVQESWRLVALVYLHMAPCGADSKDARVTKVHAKFMKLYATVEACRMTDSFLVLPILILGLPGPVKERKLIRETMLDLMERLQPNTFGNKVLRTLDDIWVRVVERGRVGSAGASSSVLGARVGAEESSGRSRGTGDVKGASAVVWMGFLRGMGFICLIVETGMAQ